jgi:hypothetical protein
MQAGGVQLAPCAYRLIRDIAQLSQKPVLQLLPESIKTSLQRAAYMIWKYYTQLIALK